MVPNGEVGIHVLHRQGGLKAMEGIGNSQLGMEVSGSWQVAANLQRSKDWGVKIGWSGKMVISLEVGENSW